MNILYGVVGEGMGHATRSRVVIEHMLSQGHRVWVVTSGNAFKFLKESLADYSVPPEELCAHAVGGEFSHGAVHVDAISGLSLNYADNKLSFRRSVRDNIRVAPRSLTTNINAHGRLRTSGFRPDIVFSDFESWSYFYAQNYRLPLISVDNMQVINRCDHQEVMRHTDTKSQASFQVAKATVKAKLPGADHYLMSSFFFPPVKKSRSTLVGPILRPQILDAKREKGEHVVVYQRALPEELLISELQKLPEQFYVYGGEKIGCYGNVTVKPFSQNGFIDDLRTAKAVIAGGGYSLMGEAVHLGVPMMAIPIEGQFEQGLNALWLQRLSYGAFEEKFDIDAIREFLGRVEIHQRALESYPRHGNRRLFECVDELLLRHGSKDLDRAA